MVLRYLVLAILALRTMVSSSTESVLRRSSDPIVKALASFGYHAEFPINSNHSCLYSNTSYCYRLEFRIELPAVHSLSARLFINKDSTSGSNVSLLWPHSSQPTRVEDDWVYFETTPCLQKVREHVFHCSIEYAGDGDVFERSEKQLPFLVVSSGARSRRRRMTSPCAVKDHYVDSKDLGHGEAIPQSINVKTCAGECHVNVGAFKNDYARAMYLYHKRKGLHIPDEQWKPTCQITGMESINLFFKTVVGGNVTFVETKVENLVVKSCGCRVHMCSTP